MKTPAFIFSLFSSERLQWTRKSNVFSRWKRAVFLFLAYLYLSCLQHVWDIDGDQTLLFGLSPEEMFQARNEEGTYPQSERNQSRYVARRYAS